MRLDLVPLLRKFGNLSWQLFHNDMSSVSLGQEFTNDAGAFRVRFKSTEVVVPTTSLVVAIVRFNFFYWLWYCHQCHVGKLQVAFEPDPRYTKGFFTFKPSAARDINKLDRALTELFSRTSREIITWAKQLGDYVEARVAPLRKVGPIIE